MKHVIMGTAGHIDHGKTALIKALSGIDCDTHREEKERGITINLGFAHLNLSDDQSISIIDVPGHKDFINTMVSGSCGIDFVLLVIAADSGIMPQTKEHMQILQMLNITRGIVALTKTDTVDEDIIELAKEEIVEFTLGTFLENSPVVPVSAITGIGIHTLKEEVNNCTKKIPQRPRGEIFRLFIDRIFTISGFGTVVTGSVMSGGLKMGESVYLLPRGKKLRVRRLEKHASEVESVVAGDRVAINLVGLNRDEFKRGMVLSDRLMQSTNLLDAKLELFAHVKKIKIWTDAIFLLGTYEMQVKIHLLNGNVAHGGETVLVQIHLPFMSNICIHDRFIIRSSSQDVTIGGGEIIDSLPLHHRRRPDRLIQNLQEIAEGNLQKLITYEVRKQNRIQTHIELAELLNASVTDIYSVINSGLSSDIKTYRREGFVYLITNEQDKAIRNKVSTNIQTFHKNNPIVEHGRTIKELVGIVGLDNTRNGVEYCRCLLEALVTEKKLKQVDNTWVSTSHRVVITTAIEDSIKLLDTFFQNFDMKIAPHSEIENFLKTKSINNRSFQQIITHLINQKSLYQIEGDYIHANTVDPTRIKLLKALNATPAGLTVAQFRDLVANNRKICLRLYSLFDKEGMTFRKGDVRVITDKGKKFIQGIR